MSGEFHMADLTTLLEDDQPVMNHCTPGAIVESLIASRDQLRGLHVFMSSDDHAKITIAARSSMSDAANHIIAERKALLDVANLAEDERQRANRLMELLSQARDYVSDAIDAYHHDDGIALLRTIDAETRGDATS